MKNLVNYYLDGQFYEGVITHYSEFCKNHCTSEKCMNHYKKMEENKQMIAYEPVNIFDLQDEETLVIAKFGSC